MIFSNLISEREVDSFLGDVDRPDLGVDDHLVGVGEPSHVGGDLKGQSEFWGLSQKNSRRFYPEHELDTQKSENKTFSFPFSIHWRVR